MKVPKFDVPRPLTPDILVPATRHGQTTDDVVMATAWYSGGVSDDRVQASTNAG